MSQGSNGQQHGGVSMKCMCHCVTQYVVMLSCYCVLLVMRGPDEVMMSHIIVNSITRLFTYSQIEFRPLLLILLSSTTLLKELGKLISAVLRLANRNWNDERGRREIARVGGWDINSKQPLLHVNKNANQPLSVANEWINEFHPSGGKNERI